MAVVAITAFQLTALSSVQYQQWWQQHNHTAFTFQHLEKGNIYNIHSGVEIKDFILGVRRPNVYIFTLKCTDSQPQFLGVGPNNLGVTDSQIPLNFDP